MDARNRCFIYYNNFFCMTTLESYIVQRLLKAEYTTFVNGIGDTEYICTDDGLARCHASHTHEAIGSCTFSNFNHRHSPDFTIETAMVEFYKNSLSVGDPMIADTVICKESLIVPKFLRKLTWEHDPWFIFNSKMGILTEKWWHIYGNFPSVQ